MTAIGSEQSSHTNSEQLVVGSLSIVQESATSMLQKSVGMLGVRLGAKEGTPIGDRVAADGSDVPLDGGLSKKGEAVTGVGTTGAIVVGAVGGAVALLAQIEVGPSAMSVSFRSAHFSSSFSSLSHSSNAGGKSVAGPPKTGFPPASFHILP